MIENTTKININQKQIFQWFHNGVFQGSNCCVSYYNSYTWACQEINTSPYIGAYTQE